MLERAEANDDDANDLFDGSFSLSSVENEGLLLVAVLLLLLLDGFSMLKFKFKFILYLKTASFLTGSAGLVIDLKITELINFLVLCRIPETLK